MPTRKALRHSRRRNTDLRVFYFLTYIRHHLLIGLSNYFLYDRYDTLNFKKIPGVTNTYDTRLISVLAGQMPQAAY